MATHVDQLLMPLDVVLGHTIAQTHQQSDDPVATADTDTIEISSKYSVRTTREVKPKLELISGCMAVSTNAANRTHLYALAPPRPIAAQQLALPGIGPAKRAIVSFGLNGQALGRLNQLLREHDIRYVADVRISPSFRGPDYGPDDVMRLFARSSIKYRRFPKLSNGFIGESLNHRIVLDMYDQYLTTQNDGLHELHRAVDQGPLLLLGWEEQHAPSERSVVIDALSRIGANFDLIIATAH